MSLQKDQIVSAEVILRSASGRDFNPNTPITSENILEFAPSSQAVRLASQSFATLEFEVGPLAGISFSITASVETFERVFGIRLEMIKEGSIWCIYKNGKVGMELPLEGLPEEVREVVRTITFAPPDYFGPPEL